ILKLFGSSVKEAAMTGFDLA
ncbi:unnamed protein product, partial [Rotaria magnacalcarata]